MRDVVVILYVGRVAMDVECENNPLEIEMRSLNLDNVCAAIGRTAPQIILCCFGRSYSTAVTIPILIVNDY